MAERLRLLGSPQLESAGEPLELSVGRATALLLYLAYRGDWVDREELLYLFWPDSGERQARSTLRQLLTSVRRLGFASDLQVAKSMLRWQVTTDVQEFRVQYSAGSWGKAVACYGGPLLEGFRLPRAAGFESWLELERGDVNQAYSHAASCFAEELAAGDRYAQAAELLGGLCRLDPFDEGVRQRYLSSLYLAGQKRRALSAYEEFSRLLEEELGSEPEAATVELVSRIRRGEPLADSGGEAKPRVGVRGSSLGERLVRLPLHATPFVGRRAELLAVAERLSEPSCRLLTVVGPGGIGKTRLAVQAATQQQEAFEDGTAFVALSGVTDHELLVPMIAGALDFEFYGQLEPRDQLLGYLRSKHLLLVLDNLEQLLPGVDLLHELLRTAPRVKLLVTSRERLHLHSEWVYELTGLGCPEPGAFNQRVAEFDAVKLLLQAAHRTGVDLVLDGPASAAVGRLCRAVDGLPLALELAANWLHVLPLDNVVARIEGGGELLEASASDVPERHRSISVVFDHSWRYLSIRERESLMRLSVFRGDFTFGAAEAVARLDGRSAQTLVDKSFLQLGASGRYHIHPLLQQYLTARLAEELASQIPARDDHSTYFLRTLLAGWREREGDPKRFEELRMIDLEFGNFRVAWEWAVERGRVKELAQSAEALAYYFDMRGLAREGAELLARAATALDGLAPAPVELLATLAAWEGKLRFRQDDLESAARLSERSLALQPVETRRPSVGLALDTLGWVARWTPGNLPLARDYFSAELDNHEARRDQLGIGIATARLGFIEMLLGNLSLALELRHKAHRLLVEFGDPIGIVTSLMGLGALRLELGELEQARDCFAEGQRRAQEIDYKEGERVHLSYLGCVHRQLGEYERAAEWYRAAIELAAERGYDIDAAADMKELAQIYLAMGEHSSAVTSIRAALAVAREPGPLFLRAERTLVVQRLVATLAEVDSARGEFRRAAELTGFLLLQEPTDPELQEQVGELAGRLQASLSKREYATAIGSARFRSPDEVLSQLISDVH